MCVCMYRIVLHFYIIFFFVVCLFILLPPEMKLIRHAHRSSTKNTYFQKKKWKWTKWCWCWCWYIWNSIENSINSIRYSNLNRYSFHICNIGKSFFFVFDIYNMSMLYHQKITNSFFFFSLWNVYFVLSVDWKNVENSTIWIENANFQGPPQIQWDRHKEKEQNENECWLRMPNKTVFQFKVFFFVWEF